MSSVNGTWIKISFWPQSPVWFGLYICLQLLLTISISAQGNVKFSARADQNKVVAGGSVEVAFVLENAKTQRFSPPDFSPFSIASGPFRGTSTQIINGKVTSSQSWTYVLQAPSGTGKYTIAPASAVVGGRTYRTGKIDLEVIDAPEEEEIDELIGSGTEPLVLRSRISKDTSFPGEQTYLIIEVLYRVDLQDVDIVKMPELNNFTEAGVGLLRNPRRRVELNGVTYFAQTVRKLALYPLRSGQFTIGPVIARASVVQEQRRQGVFSLFPRTRAVRLNSNSLEVTVLPLPDDPPPSFFGAIGKHRFQTIVDKVSLSTDDAITLELRVQGPGEARRLKKPDFSRDERFDAFNPDWIERDYDLNNGTILHRNRFQVTLVPREAGEFYWSPAYTYFDTDSMAYVTVMPDTFFFEVRQGSGTPVRQELEDQVDRDELFTGVLDVARVRSGPSHFFGSTLFWLLYLLTPGFFVGRVVYRRWINYREANKDPIPPETRLINRLTAIENNEMEGDWISLTENGLEDLLSLRLGMEKADMNRQTIINRMQQKGFTSELIDEYVEIDKKLELLSYTGASTAQQPDGELLERIKAWLSDVLRNVEGTGDEDLETGGDL